MKRSHSNCSCRGAWCKPTQEIRRKGGGTNSHNFQLAFCMFYVWPHLTRSISILEGLLFWRYKFSRLSQITRDPKLDDPTISWWDNGRQSNRQNFWHQVLRQFFFTFLQSHAFQNIVGAKHEFLGFEQNFLSKWDIYLTIYSLNIKDSHTGRYKKN